MSDSPEAQAEAALTVLNNLNSTPTPTPDNLIVPYDPENPGKRLGRPRKNLPLSEPPVDSSKNENEAILSKFRLDNQPVEGPGSRGGRNKVRSRGRIDRPRQKQQSNKQRQMVLDMVGGNVGLKQVSPKKPKLILKLKTSTSTTTSSTGCSRTTVRNSRNKLTRQLPGPLVGLYYDLYDDNLQDQVGQSEQLALGYDVTPSDSAGDVTFLIGYLLKFGDIINWDKNIGPSDIEQGLGLVEDTPVSPDMTVLFVKLLSLILNRKKEITSVTKAITELKPMTTTLGLPHEWETTATTTSEPTQTEPEDILDPSHPEILTPESSLESVTTTTYNPFYDTPEFETQGTLDSLNPKDRLILLRTLAQWTLTSSDIIKQAISQSIQTQDVPGDRETQYAARSILYGIKNCLDVKRQSELKLAKRKQDQPEDVKYIDPCTNPLLHTLNLRLNQLVIGDLGFRIGRFYLVRMAQDFNGGLASVNRMERIRQGIPMSPLPSSFKLYVEDTHEMLVQALSHDGIEFDDEQEVVSEVTDKPIWYQVAESVEQLEKFTNHINEKIESMAHSSVIYNPTVQLYEYLNSLLPLLKKQQDVIKTTVDVRSTRKIINYSNTYESEEEQEEDEPELIIEDGDEEDDNYEEVSEEEDEYMD
ncbi:hypothetical protein JA1_004765 [Spathaspora sp. JA1]|nr:hypothetical protein JA1_004765 [Spathaspora sp. JA1]